MKKRVMTILTATMLIACLAAPAAFAHGGHGPGVHGQGQGQGNGTGYHTGIRQHNVNCTATYCNLENCNLAGQHYHGHGHGQHGCYQL